MCSLLPLVLGRARGQSTTLFSSFHKNLPLLWEGEADVHLEVKFFFVFFKGKKQAVMLSINVCSGSGFDGRKDLGEQGAWGTRKREERNGGGSGNITPGAGRHHLQPHSGCALKRGGGVLCETQLPMN